MKTSLKVFVSVVLFSAVAFFTSQPALAAAYTNSQNLPASYKNIGSPFGNVVLANGDIWYVDRINYRLVKIDQSGNILRTVGRQGDGEGEFHNVPDGLTMDNAGHLYVLEFDGCKIDVFDSNGGLLNTWGQCGDSQDYTMSNPLDIHYDAFSDNILITDTVHNRVLRFTKDGQYISKFGVPGTGDGQFDGPTDITTNAQGDMYVTDGGANQRVQVFNPDNSFKFKFSSPGYNAVAGIALLSNGDIIVTSQNSYETYKYDSTGNFIKVWGGGGGGDGQFISPHYISVDASDNIFISDWGQNAIQKFDQNGNFLWSFRNGGLNDGEFFSPGDVAFDSTGDMYTIDDGGYHARIQKFTNSGTFISTIVQPDTTIADLACYHITIVSDKLYIPCHNEVFVLDTDGNLLNTIGSGGTSDGQFVDARKVGVDSGGNVYVPDLFNSRVEKFDNTGAYVSQWGTFGSGNGEFNDPHLVIVDGSNNVYVADDTRIQKFDTDGNYLGTIWSQSIDSQNFNVPSGIAFDSSHNMFISVRDSQQVQMFDNTDTYTGFFGSYGSGVDQFQQPGGVAVNPVTNTIVVSDSNNRIEYFDVGVRIQGLIPSADVISNSGSKSLVRAYWDPSTPGINDINSTMNFGSYIVSDFSVDLSNDRNWSTVNAFSIPDDSKSLLVNLNTSDAPGISATHTLYIVKQTGQIGVYICPNATALDDLTTSCSGGYILRDGDAGISTVNIGGVDYWKIPNLVGTGGLGLKASDVKINVSSTNVNVNESFSATVTAHDQNNSNYIFYEGTVHFTSNSGSAVLPSNFTYSDLDLGTHDFTNQFAFTQPGDYTITVADLGDGSLTATSQTIHVTGTAPTSTPTGTVAPTSTPAPGTPTATPVPPTPTTAEVSCVDNQLQAKCQVDIVISNIVASTLDNTSEEICWDTNIETKGIIRYGLASAGLYDQTTPFEDSYIITNHCFTLTGLTNNSRYNYAIESDSPAGKVGIYNGSFVIGVETLPATGGTTVGSCIALDGAISFNSANQAIVKYTSSSTAGCSISYGNSSNKAAFTSDTSNGTSHTNTLGLDNLDGKTDAYYQINCNVAATSTDDAKTCSFNNVIVASQYVPYLKSQSTTAIVLNDFVGGYFGTPVKTAQTLNGTAVVGTIATAAIATLAYPQWLSYGLLWFRGRKKAKPWGLVYNAGNLSPVPFATVRAINGMGQDVKQSITDTTGRFSFVLDAGTYNITVDASGFDHFEKQVKIAGEQTVNFDIPLKGEGKMGFFTALQHGVRGNLGKISIALTIIGYIFTITSVILAPNIINISVLIAYFVQSAILLFGLKEKGNGYIFDSKTGARIKGAFVRLYDVEEQRQVDVQMADPKGRYGFIGDKKQYLIRVDAPGYKFPGAGTKGEMVKAPNGEMFLKTENANGIHDQIGLDPV